MNTARLFVKLAFGGSTSLSHDFSILVSVSCFFIFSCFYLYLIFDFFHFPRTHLLLLSSSLLFVLPVSSRSRTADKVTLVEFEAPEETVRAKLYCLPFGSMEDEEVTLSRSFFAQAD